MIRLSTQCSAIAVLVAGLAFSAPAAAADLIIEEPAMPGVVDVGGNWDGFYLGIFAGAASYTLSESEAFAQLATDGEIGLSGGLIGVAAGANFYLSDNIVGGIVGDIAWANLNGEGDYTPYAAEANVNWLGSVRGKLGLDAGAIMPYLTAGLAFANAEVTDYDIGGAGYSDSNTHIGWTAGAGVEIAATEDLSIDILYRYSDYGAKEYDVYGDTEAGLSGHSITAGLNWKF